MNKFLVWLGWLLLSSGGALTRARLWCYTHGENLLAEAAHRQGKVFDIGDIVRVDPGTPSTAAGGKTLRVVWPIRRGRVSLESDEQAYDAPAYACTKVSADSPITKERDA